MLAEFSHHQNQNLNYAPFNIISTMKFWQPYKICNHFSQQALPFTLLHFQDALPFTLLHFEDVYKQVSTDIILSSISFRNHSLITGMSKFHTFLILRVLFQNSYSTWVAVINVGEYPTGVTKDYIFSTPIILRPLLSALTIAK